MAPIPNTISHFMHPNHELTQINVGTRYICDGCKMQGTGKRFNCASCSFDLHEYCANCPASLTTTKHPHPLQLAVHRPDLSKAVQPCGICPGHEPILGLMYECKGCSYVVHPVCVSQYLEKHGQPSAGSFGSTAQRMGEQVAIGLATRAAFEGIKQVVLPNNTQTPGSQGIDEGVNSFNEGEIAGDLEEEGVSGFMDAVKDVFTSVFDIFSS